MILAPQLTSQIAHWRAKQAEGTMTIEDWKQCFAALRDARSSAQAASNASKGRKSKAPVNTEALKDSLRGLMMKKT